MKKIIPLLFLLIAINAQSQEITKKVKIYKSISAEYIDAHEVYNDGMLTDIYITFMGQNHKYQRITDIISLYSGSPKGFYIYINNIKEFLNTNDVDTSATINGQYVSISKMMGKKIINVYTSDTLGYRVMTVKSLDKILKKFEKWAKDNNIEYY